MVGIAVNSASASRYSSVRKVQLRRGLVGLFLAAALAMLLAFNAYKPRVMIVYSQPSNSVATQHMDQGIREVLAGSRAPITVERHYLNLKHGLTVTDWRQAQAEAKRAIRRREPDVLVLADDEANRMLAAHHAEPRSRIVYVSTNDAPQSYGYADAQRVTGISEQLPLTAVSRLVSDLKLGSALRIAVLGKRSATAESLSKQIDNFAWAPHRVVSQRYVDNEQQWREAVEALRGQADVLLITNLAGLRAGFEGQEWADEQELVAWTQKHAAPLPIGLTGTYTERGGALSISPSRHEQGALAMRAALEWLDKRGASGPPQAATMRHFDVHLRQQALIDRGIDIPAIYAEAARAAGHLHP